YPAGGLTLPSGSERPGLVAAGWTPGRPEVDDDRMAAEFRQLEIRPSERSEREVRRGMGSNLSGATHRIDAEAGERSHLLTGQHQTHRAQEHRDDSHECEDDQSSAATTGSRLSGEILGGHCGPR